VSLNKAFEYVMTVSGLAYWQDGNSLVIASKNVASNLGINKAMIKPIQVKYLDAGMIADFLNNNVFSINKPEISVHQVATSNPRTNQVLIFGNENDYVLAKKTIELIDVKPLIKTIDVNYANPEVLANTLCMNVFDSNVSTSGTGNSGNNGSNQNSGNNGNSGNNQNSGTAGAGSDRQTGTVTVCSGQSILENESTGTISASSNASGDAKGFSGISSEKKSILTNSYLVMADNDLSRITISASQDKISLAEEMIKNLDKKQSQVYIEVSIIELSESGSKSLSGVVSGRFGTTVANFAGDSTIISNANGIWHDLHTKKQRLIVSEIEALISQRKGKVLANPRIIATNNQTSTVNISEDYIAKRTVDRQTTGNTVSNIITYETGQAGIELGLTPRISPNGYITLDIIPSYTSIKEQVKEGAELIATLLNRRDLDLKNVRIKDGETLILGGLVQESDTSDVKKVPILGDLPVIGALFRNSSTDRTRSELILMITPKILNDDEVSTL
ncbi:MAG TPA: hypothetical protein DDX14_04900, partial [Cyanobacteria bacterium UBA9579]|nr:hypothetical protein [Cyanobacteria bacterium UBA9579]